MRNFILVLLFAVVGCTKVPMPVEPEIAETAGDAYGEQGVPAVQAEPFDITFNFMPSTALMPEPLHLSVRGAGAL